MDLKIIMKRVNRRAKLLFNVVIQTHQTYFMRIFRERPKDHPKILKGSHHHPP